MSNNEFDLGISGLGTNSMDEMGNDRGKWLIHGPQGSGKSTLASTIARCGRTLYIDLPGEKGVKSFAGAQYAKNVKVTRPTSVTQFDDIFWKLAEGDHPYEAVVVDSLTSVQKMAMRFILGHSETAVKEIRQGTAPADMRSWGQTLDIMIDFATFWYGLADADRIKPMHVVMTAQTKMSDNEDTGERDRVPDVQKGALSMTLAAPDYILYTETVANLDAIGDDDAPPALFTTRFGAHPGYRTKGRVPVNLRNKIPPVLGRPNEDGKITAPTDLTWLSRVLGIGGVPAVAKKAAATPAAAATTNEEK